MFKNISAKYPVIAWWSGGADSAITCWLCLQWFGADCVRVVGIDTNNEDPDTYRFKSDCEKWYGVKIETIRSKDWKEIEEVWDHYLSLNVATGAICSTELKRVVRQNFQMKNKYSYQAFGFDANELNRARNMRRNYPDSSPIFPLIYELMGKGESIKLLQKHGIEVPLPYRMGFQNNNCFKTGCVQGGIGYWQKMKAECPDKFLAMAQREHRYTDLKGEPVTICKDQSKKNGKKAALVFLLPHPKYPHIKDISMMKGRMAESLMDCNGFCHVPDKTPKVAAKTLTDQNIFSAILDEIHNT